MYFHTLVLNKAGLILFCIVFSFLACKKKKDETPVPLPSNTPTAPTPKPMTAKVNGIPWEMASNAYSAYKSGGVYGFSGRTSSSPPFTVISFSFPHTVGTMTIGPGGFGVTFTDSSNVYHYGQTGTLTITQLDTSASSGFPNRIKGNFSFMTAGTYTVTEGVIDWTRP